MEEIASCALENWFSGADQMVILPKSVVFFGWHDLPEGLSVWLTAPNARYEACTPEGRFEYRRTAEGAVLTRWCFWREAVNGPTLRIPQMLDGWPVVRIGEKAFDQSGSNATSPAQIILPEGMKALDARAFAGCTAQMILLPSTLTEVAEDSFCGCWTEVILAAGNPVLTREGGYLVDQRTSTLLFADRTVGTSSVPRVRRIGRCALRNWGSRGAKSLAFPRHTLVIPEGVEYIGSFQVFGNDSVSALVLPDSLKEIDTDAFHNSGIETVHIGTGLTSLPDDCFTYNVLPEITLPPNVLFVSWMAFPPYTEVTARNPACHFETLEEYQARKQALLDSRK